MKLPGKPKVFNYESKKNPPQIQNFYRHYVERFIRYEVRAKEILLFIEDGCEDMQQLSVALSDILLIKADIDAFRIQHGIDFNEPIGIPPTSVLGQTNPESSTLYHLDQVLYVLDALAPTLETILTAHRWSEKINHSEVFDICLDEPRIHGTFTKLKEDIETVLNGVITIEEPHVETINNIFLKLGIRALPELKSTLKKITKIAKKHKIEIDAAETPVFFKENSIQSVSIITHDASSCITVSNITQYTTDMVFDDNKTRLYLELLMDDGTTNFITCSLASNWEEDCIECSNAEFYTNPYYKIYSLLSAKQLSGGTVTYKITQVQFYENTQSMYNAQPVYIEPKRVIN
jgi:hypothetical protein